MVKFTWCCWCNFIMCNFKLWDLVDPMTDVWAWTLSMMMIMVGSSGSAFEGDQEQLLTTIPLKCRVWEWFSALLVDAHSPRNSSEGLQKSFLILFSSFWNSVHGSCSVGCDWLLTAGKLGSLLRKGTWVNWIAISCVVILRQLFYLILHHCCRMAQPWRMRWVLLVLQLRTMKLSTSRRFVN